MANYHFCNVFGKKIAAIFNEDQGKKIDFNGKKFAMRKGQCSEQLKLAFHLYGLELNKTPANEEADLCDISPQSHYTTLKAKYFVEEDSEDSKYNSSLGQS